MRLFRLFLTVFFLICIFFTAKTFLLTFKGTNEFQPSYPHPSNTDRFPTSRNKSYRHLDVQVVMVVSDVAVAEKDYGTALSTVRCYCRIHKYQFRLIEDVEYRNACRQKDFMFRRHCIVAELLKDTEWVVFLDADVAVVNPNFLLEDFINESFDITFYDRFQSWEVAAGSYIVHNTTYANDFLKKFADFESKLPDSFHGTDNGALHVYLQQTFYPQLAEQSRICLKIWNSSTSFQDLFTFESCLRAVMGDVREFGKVRILKKGTAWVRDIWLSDSKWSPERDFMLHGLKEANKVETGRGFMTNKLFGKFNWRSPFLSPLNFNDCVSTDNWNFDKRLMVSKREIEEMLMEKFKEVERKKWKSLAAVAGCL